MSSVHRITLQALRPDPGAACDRIARFIPDAVFSPIRREDEVVEVLIPAADVEAALDRTWDAIAAEGDCGLFAVVGAPRDEPRFHR